MAEIAFRSVLLLSAVFRVVLIFYGEWQDAHMAVRYTDIDYFVFSDAAALMVSGKSPYDRSTYRYSPLLAFLLMPNSFLHQSWGKFLFSASGSMEGSPLWGDLVEHLKDAAELIVLSYELLAMETSMMQTMNYHNYIELTDLLVGLLIHRILKLRGVPEKLSTYSAMVWLFNPFTFTIGTRGNCEPIVCSMILWILICLMKDNLIQAAFWYGLVVHLRIYPIIYALPIIILLDPLYFQHGKKPALGKWSFRTSESSLDSSNAEITGFWNLFRSLITWRRVVFGILSGTTFLIFTGLSFYLYGWDFLHEALLYHLTRTDPRHNFSIYFYHIYLHYEHEFSILEKLISFLPQFIVQLILILRFALDLPFCLFLQTVAFVAFNKVITAQYFVWFFCLLPLILPWSNMRLKWRGLACVSVWIGAQTHWLMWGYLLEFRGKNVFLQLWMASLLFLAANTFVMINIIRSHVFCPLFKPSSSKSVKDD